MPLSLVELSWWDSSQIWRFFLSRPFHRARHASNNNNNIDDGYDDESQAYSVAMDNERIYYIISHIIRFFLLLFIFSHLLFLLSLCSIQFLCWFASSFTPVYSLNFNAGSTVQKESHATRKPKLILSLFLAAFCSVHSSNKRNALFLISMINVNWNVCFYDLRFHSFVASLFTKKKKQTILSFWLIFLFGFILSL